MFIGHYAVALASKKLNASPSLPMLFIAVQALDLLWPIFLLTGIEHFDIVVGDTKLTPLHFSHYPYSHSLLMALVWAFLLGAGYFWFTKNKIGAWWLSGLVVSHWVLDFLTHRADLPLTPFSDVKVGLGLWNHPAIEIFIEVSLFILGIVLYVRTVKPRRTIVFWSLILFLAVIHFLNIAGPPPPSQAAVAWSSNLLWLFVAWAWWVEKK